MGMASSALKTVDGGVVGSENCVDKLKEERTNYKNRADEDPIVAKVIRSRADIGANQVFFRPCLVYQEISADHVCDKRLEFRSNFETGLNHGRFSSSLFGNDIDQDTLENSSPARQELLDKQLTFVPDADIRADKDTIITKLKTAAAFADTDLMKYLIRTTYCTFTIGSQVLAETVKEGNLEVVQLLLECGANPGYVMHQLDDRTSLHFAASIGREDVCSKLIQNMKKKEDAYKKTGSSGMTAFEILIHEQDLGMMARRLTKLADELPE